MVAPGFWPLQTMDGEGVTVAVVVLMTFSVVVGTGSTVVLVLVMVNVVSVTVTVVAMTTFVTCCAALLAADGRAQYWPMQIVGVGRSGGKLQ